jgi:uncharacterized membrane protein YkvA (DUF1232 family)
MARRRKLERQHKSQLKSRLVDLILFIPNLLFLLVAMMRDRRVSSADKSIIAGVIIYVISPLDIIPDFIPFIGQVDDSYLLAIAILRLLNRADRGVVMQHWKGQIDIKELVTNIAAIAEVFLPNRIKNVLRGRIDRPRKKVAHLSVVPDSQAADG